MEYTKGEWELIPRPDENVIRINCYAPSYESHVPIADVFGNHDDDLDNARLISAAPELYEVLKKAMENPNYVLSGEWYKPALLALAKAGGKNV